MNITITHLSKSYGKISILKDINYTFIGERKYHIRGENGTGKSTLFKSILKQVEYYGKIEINGRISYQPEDTVFPPYMKVKSFLNIFPTLTSDVKDIDLKIDEMLKVFSIYKLKDAYLGSLSKGEKQKVNLIQALITPSEILILDEPLSGLDKESRKIFLDMLENEKRLVIVVSHNMEEFINYNYIFLEFDKGDLSEVPETVKSSSFVSFK